MKTLSVFLLVAFAVIGITDCGILKTPKIHGQRSERSNWEAVEWYAYEITEFTTFMILDVMMLAYEDPTPIGPVIGAKIADAFWEGTSLIEIVAQEIEDRTLTVELARTHFGQLLVLFSDLYGSIEVDLFQLTDNAREQITLQFSNFFLTVPKMADNIYQVLEEELPTCGIMGHPSNETVTLPNPLEYDLPPGTEVWNKEIYSTKFISVLINPHNKYLDSELTSSGLSIKTTQDYPNFLKENNVTSLERILIFHCDDDTRAAYHFQFPINDAVVEPTLSPSVLAPQ